MSRWLWLVKWLLVIPHVIVLAFLLPAFFVLTVYAGVKIFLEGVYPRRVFDFNVGVMRWTWRVAYYSYSALGTDAYPPFSLAPDPDYPAGLEVDYPERLSRGLVLVKWWLLAIPQYIVVAIFANGGSFLGLPTVREHLYAFSGGLVGVLVLAAGILLLVTRQYPTPLFDVVMGMNRWVWRVWAYAALMRDEYPPFRFDAGGPDPADRIDPGAT